MNAPAIQKSTIVRTLNLAFGVLERYAPAPGAVLAERLWCTVPEGKITPFTRPGERISLTVNGGAVTAEAFGTGPAVYLMHGWGGWRGQFDAFAEPLVAAGYRVVALDAPSHGDSAPGGFGKRRGVLPDFLDALRAAVTRFGPAHAIVGHSLGGAASALAVLDGVAAERVVLIAAMSDPVGYTRDFARTLGFGERIRSGFVRRLERRVGRPMADFSVTGRAATAGALPPLLIIHDRLDKEVSHAGVAEVAKVWPGATMVLTDGLGHRRILRSPEVISQVLDFLSPKVGNARVSERSVSASL